MFPRLKNYPTDGTLTLAAGDTYQIDLGEKSSNFLRVSIANAAFRIRLNDTYEIAMTAGKKIDTLPSKFSKVEVINTSAGALTFQLEIGSGQITSDEVVLGGTSQVNDAVTQAAIAALQVGIEAALEEVEVEINDLMDLLKNDELKRAPLTTLSGASYAEASNTTTVICSSGANVNGVIIRRGNAVVGGSLYSAIRVNGNPVTLPIGSSTYGGESPQFIENLHIPAGVSVDLISNSVAYKANAWYEVL